MTSKEKLHTLSLLCNDPDIHNIEKALIEAYNLALEDAAQACEDHRQMMAGSLSQRDHAHKVASIQLKDAIESLKIQ